MRTLFLISIALLLSACQPDQTTDTTEKAKPEVNIPSAATVGFPAMANFNQDGSDAKAIALADQVMEAMGGYDAWKNTRYIRWNFFGMRTLTWDKQDEKVRIDFLDQPVIVSAGVDGVKGWAARDGQVIGDIQEAIGWVKKAKDLWSNDSYWLVMPFKLKDDGVTLTYIGADSTEAGTPAEVIELTFADVGITPNNKYHVYIDTETHLVSQWAFYGEKDEAEPRFILPWKDYQTYGKLKLSGNRGERHLTNIAVLDEVPEGFFNDPQVSMPNAGL